MRLIIILLLLLSGCAPTSTAFYYNDGVEHVPTALALNSESSFRFLERWHISFSWFSGPAGVHACSFGKNPFKGRMEYGEVALDKNAPHWAWKNAVVGPYIDNEQPFSGRLKIMINGDLDSPYDAITIGQLGKEGNIRYATPCAVSLSESFTSATATFLNVKLHKNANSLVQGSNNVQIGNNRWRVVKNTVSDYPGTGYGNQPVLERWILEMPETDYWMVFTFYASKQFSYVERREAYERARDLFRQSIASVSIYPIAPFVDQEKIILPYQCIKRHPISPWICPISHDALVKPVEAQ
jgi:hypothetical protein